MQVMVGIGDVAAAESSRLGAVLSVLGECNSEKELVIFLRRRFEEEMALRPRLEAALRNARRLKLLEQKTVNRITYRSIMSLRRRCFQKWRAAVAARRRLNDIGLQLFKKYRGIMLRAYMKTWRLAVRDALLKKQQQHLLDVRNAIKRANMLKEQTSKKIRDTTNALQELQVCVGWVVGCL